VKCAAWVSRAVPQGSRDGRMCRYRRQGATGKTSTRRWTDHSHVRGVLTPSQAIFSRRFVIPRRSSMIPMTCLLALSTSSSQFCVSVFSAASESEVGVLSDFASFSKCPTGTRMTTESFPSGAADGSLAVSLTFYCGICAETWNKEISLTFAMGS